MLTTLAGLCLNKRQNRGAGPRTDALQAASEVLKQLGRKATLAVILRLEGLRNLHRGVRAIESLQRHTEDVATRHACWLRNPRYKALTTGYKMWLWKKKE